MNVSRAAVRCLVLVSTLALPLVACSAAPTSTEEATTDQVGQSQEDLSVCLPGLCCIATGRAWNTADPFEDQMYKWGCNPPSQYSPNASTGAWWMWTTCPDPKRQVQTFLSTHPVYTQPPYSAKAGMFVGLIGCTIPALLPGTVDVIFDPTCATCSTSFLKLL